MGLPDYQRAPDPPASYSREWWGTTAQNQAATALAEADKKPTNPKDLIGSAKLDLGLVPDTLSIFAAVAFTEGAVKYGSMNWRVGGARASIYHAALKRHLAKWWNGEDTDTITKVPHLASVIACAAILLDADVVDKLTDDRPPKARIADLITEHEAVVAHLKALHKDLSPKHNFATDIV